MQGLLIVTLLMSWCGLEIEITYSESVRWACCKKTQLPIQDYQVAAGGKATVRCKKSH